MGKPARGDLDRSAHARHRAEHLYSQGAEGERRAVGDRVRNLPRGQESAQGSGGQVIRNNLAIGRSDWRLLRSSPRKRELSPRFSGIPAFEGMTECGFAFL